MKPKTFITVLAVAALFLSAAAFAADYSNYSLKELSHMRCNMMNMSQEDRNAFRTAWRQKMQDASAQERQKYAWRKGNCKGMHGNGDCNGCKSTGRHGHGHHHSNW